MGLGLVDLGAPLEEQVRALTAACEDIGFFRIPLDSIPSEVAEAAWAAATEFFALPEAVKREVEFPEPGYPYGYSPLGFESLAKSLGDSAAPPDMKESLSVGPDCGRAVVSPAAQEWIRSPSLWPAAVPELRAAWTAYYRALSDVAARLMSVMACALELPSDYFRPLIDRPITSMRALHYPADGSAGQPSGLRAGAHADYGTLTILRTDDVGGLQIDDGAGDWIDVESDPATFIVNLGDSISQWTNGRWPSTVHRVVPRPQARQSMAFFHMANWDATIECLPGCESSDGTALHEPVLAGPWLMQKFQSTVL